MGDTSATVPLVAKRQGDILGHKPRFFGVIQMHAQGLALKFKQRQGGIRHGAPPLC